MLSAHFLWKSSRHSGVFLLRRISNDARDLKILFIGSDELVSLPVLKFLHSEFPQKARCFNVLPLHVLTRVVQSSLNPVARYCMKNNISLINWDEYASSACLDPIHFDVGVLSSFGKLIPEHLIQATKFGIINIHPSLLPRWRGSSPLQQTILAGDRSSGVSLMLLSPNKFDVGRIISQRKFEVPQDVFTEDLARMAMTEGIDLLTQCLNTLENSTANAELQGGSGVTYAHKLKSSDGIINWSSDSVDKIWAMYRALSFMYPLLTEFRGKKLMLSEMVHPKLTVEDLIPSRFVTENVQPGTACYSSLANAVCVKCVDGFVGFQKLHLSNRAKLSALDFANGYFNERNSDIVFS